MSVFYCVFKSPQIQLENTDYMLIGGIYSKLEDARNRASQESIKKGETDRVWIEQHKEMKGWLDVVSKETLVANIPL